MTIDLLPMQDITGPSISIIVKVSKYTLSIMLCWQLLYVRPITKQYKSTTVIKSHLQIKAPNAIGLAYPGS